MKGDAKLAKGGAKPTESEAKPTEALHSRFRPTSLPAGGGALSLRGGAYVVDQIDPVGRDSRAEGVGLQGDFFLPSLSWGVTDRLQINFTRPGVSYRFGEAGQTEWLVALQSGLYFTSSTVSLLPLVRLDLRSWLGAEGNTALAASVFVQTRVDLGASFCPTNGASPSGLLTQAQLGLVHFANEWITVAPSAGFAVGHNSCNSSTHTALTFLSEISRGVWSDPFLRLHFARWGSFDLYPSLGYEISTTTLLVGGAGGFSFIW